MNRTALIAALIAAPGMAFAATVTLDFQGGVERSDVAPGTQVYIEEGFEIRAPGGSYATNAEDAELYGFPTPYGIEAALPTFSSTIATGLDLEVFTYNITRAGGGLFSLDSFMADVTDYHSIVYLYEFDDGRTLEERIRGKVGFVRFAGTRADGSIVETVADAGRAQGLGLNDIVRADIDWAYGINPGATTFYCDERNLRQLSPELAALGAPDDCGGPRAPGIKSIMARFDGEDLIGFTNYALVARVHGIGVSTSDLPAPVPLPAAAWMLLAGIAGLGGVRMRGRG